MAGEEGAELKGLSKYFNSQTYNGRANVAKATYAVIGVVILYNLIKPKKSK
ncbi:ATP synthase membrane subunit K, mitochondrial [Choristoneura fumiferana]|uniref:ATP synthase membrane subunit K, mitochondrial n=1 Tax=Choristoneura fumiferana TaxID=7141 RepID=UPI003D153CA6